MSSQVSKPVVVPAPLVLKDHVSNVGSLRTLLLEKKHKDHGAAEEIRSNLFNWVVECSGREGDRPIRKMVKWTFSAISGNLLEEDVCLVADAIKAWAIGWPGSANIVLDALCEVETICHIQKAGEGVTIGLLESFIDEPDDYALFRTFHHGPLLSVIRASKTIPTGESRLSSVLSLFLQGAWNPDHPIGSKRLPKVMLLIRTFNALLEWNVSVTLSSKVIGNLTIQTPLVNFLELFSNELTSKLFLLASPKLKSFIFCEYVKHSIDPSCSKQWLEEFPMLV